jgi:hypothetical protein
MSNDYFQKLNQDRARKLGAIRNANFKAAIATTIVVLGLGAAAVIGGAKLIQASNEAANDTTPKND